MSKGKYPLPDAAVRALQDAAAWMREESADEYSEGRATTGGASMRIRAIDAVLNRHYKALERGNKHDEKD